MTSLTAEQAEATLKPQFLKYMEAYDNSDWVTVESYFHPDAVLVNKGREATYGSKAIIANMTKFAEMAGKSKTSMSDLKYEGSENFLTVSGNMVGETEKFGSMKLKFFMIWKKEGDRHLILHDHLEVVQ